MLIFIRFSAILINFISTLDCCWESTLTLITFYWIWYPIRCKIFKLPNSATWWWPLSKVETIVVSSLELSCKLKPLLLYSVMFKKVLEGIYSLCKTFSGVARNFWVMGRFLAKLFRALGNNGQLKINWATMFLKLIAITKTYVYWTEIRQCQLRASSVVFWYCFTNLLFNFQTQ